MLYLAHVNVDVSAHSWLARINFITLTEYNALLILGRTCLSSSLLPSLAPLPLSPSLLILTTEDLRGTGSLPEMKTSFQFHT